MRPSNGGKLGELALEKNNLVLVNDVSQLTPQRVEWFIK